VFSFKQFIPRPECSYGISFRFGSKFLGNVCMDAALAFYIPLTITPTSDNGVVHVHIPL